MYDGYYGAVFPLQICLVLLTIDHADRSSLPRTTDGGVVCSVTLLVCPHSIADRTNTTHELLCTKMRPAGGIFWHQVPPGTRYVLIPGVILPLVIIVLSSRPHLVRRYVESLFSLLIDYSYSYNAYYDTGKRAASTAVREGERHSSSSRRRGEQQRGLVHSKCGLGPQQSTSTS